MPVTLIQFGTRREAITHLRKWDIRPMPPHPWPAWARFISKFKSDEDVGIGDTVKRYAAKVGGEQFKFLSGLIGLPCGCTTRQKEWNERYPYLVTLPVVQD